MTDSKACHTVSSYLHVKERYTNQKLKGIRRRQGYGGQERQNYGRPPAGVNNMKLEASSTLFWVRFVFLYSYVS
jgi:hypothetical protein